MIYELFYPLSTQYGWASAFNVLRYTPFRAIMATITAMLLCFMLAPWFIRTLQTKQIGQVVRSEGPETHRVKAGTPTMGGALILLAVLLPTVLWADVKNQFVVATTAVTAGYGLIGYIDDRLKIQGASSRGLPGRYKLLGQFAIGGAAVGYLFLADGLPKDWLDIRTRLSIPFVAFDKHPIDLPIWLYIAFGVFVVVAMSNAVNLTDGLDGLAGIITASAFAAYGVIAYLQQQIFLTQFCFILVGACFAFLWYNAHPAQLFMGDTGSLALGAALGTVAVMTGQWLLLPIVAIVPIAETLSVILQVASAKYTRRYWGVDKRIFRQAPLHGHFELGGWSETQIVQRFWLVGLLSAMIGVALALV